MIFQTGFPWRAATAHSLSAYTSHLLTRDRLKTIHIHVIWASISRWQPEEAKNHHRQLSHAPYTWWLYMALTSASNTLENLSAMQQLGSAAHPHKSSMRTWKQEAALWKEELMALLDSPTESHLPSRDCMRQQRAASILFVPYLKLTLGSFAIFPCFPQRLFLLHMLQSSFVFPTARWTHLNRETKFHHHSVLIAPSALWKNVYLLHKQVEATFNPVTLGFFNILWQSQRTQHHHQSR